MCHRAFGHLRTPRPQRYCSYRSHRRFQQELLRANSDSEASMAVWALLSRSLAFPVIFSRWIRDCARTKPALGLAAKCTM